MKVHQGPISTSVLTSDHFFVSFTPSSFRMLWVGMVAMHFLCIAFFGAECWVYWELPLSPQAPMLEWFHVIMTTPVLRAISVCFGIVTAAHCLLVFVMLLQSARQRRLTFGSISTGKRSAVDRHRSIERIARVTTLVFGDSGFLGVQGRHFIAVYVARKMLETLLQSIQAYRMSQLVSREAVNYFFVLTIVVTCWLAPLVSHAFRHNPVRVRLLCLIMDFSLAFVTAVGIPLILSVPYMKQYDYAISDFPVQFWADEVWVANMIHDLRIVFISSWAGFVAQTTFSVSVLLCLQDIKSLLRPHSPLQKASRNKPQSNSQIRNKDPPQSSDLRNLKRNESPTQAHPRGFVLPQSMSGTRFVKVLHVFMVLWGVVILALHLRVSRRSTSQYCLYEVRSWFSSKTECTILNVDCNLSAESTGNMTQIDTTLAALDERVLLHLRIQNCPFVEIPRRIQDFANLGDLKILNSTLARWDADAALTATHHPNINYFIAAQVNLSQIPLGLLAPNFPSQLGVLNFQRTNLTTVPDQAADVWPRNMYVSIDNSLLQSVPQGLLKQSTRGLSLSYNNITALPKELFSYPSAGNIWLNGNPIAELPGELVPSPLITRIDLTDTNLQLLPSWMNATFFYYTVVYASGTPLCDLILAAESSNSTAVNLLPALDAYHTAQMKCSSGY